MGLFSLKKWRLRHLLFSWVAYWLLIIAVKLGPAIVAGVDAATGPRDGTSSINANWATATGLSLQIISKGAETWSGSATVSSIIGWAVIPPLFLWVIWLWLSAAERSKHRQTAEIAAGEVEDLTMHRRTPSRVSVDD